MSATVTIRGGVEIVWVAIERKQKTRVMIFNTDDTPTKTADVSIIRV